jgi:predicted dehydrogenase
MPALSRRRFLQGTAAAGASLLITGTRASGKIVGANNRLRIAVAGVNGRGKSHIAGWLDQENVEVVYLIDPEHNALNRALKIVQQASGGGSKKKSGGKKSGVASNPKPLADVRKALEDRTLDAISIAAPNHWHSLMTIWACQAGKHVYVEKPISHDIAEGRSVVEAQKKYGVVLQHGTQSRSNAQIAGLHEAIQAGKFGRLKISYGYCCKPRAGIGFKPPTNPPANLDWTLWKGPAEVAQYHANLVPYNWHWFWKTGNGDMNNQGTHQLDIARWALDRDQTAPIRAMAIGGRFKWNDQGETPNTMFGIAQFPNGQEVFFNVRNVNYDGYEHQVQNEYYFEDGGKILPGKKGWIYYAKGKTSGEPLVITPGKVTPGGNWGAFIAACRAGKPEMANGNAVDAHYGSLMGHLMNNSYRLGTKVPFDAKAGQFGDNKEAHEHFMKLHAMMRDGVGIPEDRAQYVVGPWLNFDPVTERCIAAHATEANALLKDPNNAGFEVPAPNRV